MVELLAGLVIGAVVTSVIWRLASRGGGTRPQTPPAGPGSPQRETQEEFDRMQHMLAEIGEGVMFFSETGGVAYANAAARRMFSDAGMAVEPVLRHKELLSVVRRTQRTGHAQEATVSLWPAREALNVRAVPVGEAEVVAVIRDVGEEQRLHLVRRQFVVSASHEMKTPVTAIQALAEAGQQALDANDLDTARRFVGHLGDEAARLGRLVQDLLDLSRVEDPTNIARAPVDLGSIVTDIGNESAAAAGEKLIELKVSAEPGLWTRGDPAQLRLVVKNLLANALRYTPEGSVLVEAFRDDNNAVLRVADTGIGIPLSAQSRVFERFFRVDEGRDRASGGTGLGLSIVKHVVDLHGGRITLESELGEGSTFTVYLPVGEGVSG